jgi:iron-sulfur cluster repair protein YtfE (RIC family)
MQHLRIEALLRALRSDGYRRNRLLLELVGELTSHLAVESNLLYPTARRWLGLSLKEESALHRRTRELLAELTEAGLSGDGFAKKVDLLSAAFAAHTAREESVLLPALARGLDAAALDELGDDMEALFAALMARCRPYARLGGERAA